MFQLYWYQHRSGGAFTPENVAFLMRKTLGVRDGSCLKKKGNYHQHMAILAGIWMDICWWIYVDGYMLVVTAIILGSCWSISLIYHQTVAPFAGDNHVKSLGPPETRWIELGRCCPGVLARDFVGLLASFPSVQRSCYSSELKHRMTFWNP